ncbi:alpha/beta fold hydrolase [Sphingomonas radiodurans]|uniref:alpha/beta fold hydrolase n=1 Tax=Sphingomonas radiodurans TaxID=2890321 RepID=UPI001E446DD9|nr:alpha/beta fold hydrolase [Sphingomonas radiodurans]WBH17995.1 alpha/beta fold hydrolase [Sphingomonas radiodurans]
MVEVRRHYVDGPFGQLHVRIAGKATERPALFCFHMSPMSGRVYSNFMAMMGEDRLIVAVDTPGLGMSDTPDTPPEIGDYARAMLAAIDALDVTGPVDLMGYHTGSMIACDVARARPDEIRRLVLVSAPIFTDAEREAMRTLYAPEAPKEDGSHVLKRWNGWLRHNRPSGLPLETIADMFPDALLGRGRAWWGHRAAFNHLPDMGLPQIHQPIMVINGNDDLTDYTRKAAPLLVNGLIVERPDWSHGFLDAATRDACVLVRRFLDRDPADGDLTPVS